MFDEGYVKYRANRTEGKVPDTEWFRDLNMVRTTLWNMRLIGVYPNGIGYGNISHRHEGDQFLISGTATGDKMVLQHDQYALVDSFDLKQNSVEVIGKIDASSESMSHGAIYRVSPETNVVIHIHSRDLFDYMLKYDYLRTPEDIAFGTPELAEAIAEVVKGRGEANGIFVTAGHDEGIIAYGETLEIAYDHVETIYRIVKESKK